MLLLNLHNSDGESILERILEEFAQKNSQKDLGRFLSPVYEMPRHKNMCMECYNPLFRGRCINDFNHTSASAQVI